MSIKVLGKEDTANRSNDNNDADLDGAQHTNGIKQKSNIPSPVDHLPNEILSDILFFVVEPDEEDKLDPSCCRCDNTGYDMHLMMALVCSRWAATVSSTARLWTGICNEDSLEHAKCSLERSKDLPLDIRCHWRKHSRIEPFMELVLPHIGRWRSFWSNSQYFNNKVEDFFTRQPAPLLERFYLNTPYIYSVGSGTNGSQLVVSSLFGGNAPRLRHLEVETQPISWEGNVMQQLIHFGIIDYGENEEASCLRYNQLLRSKHSLQTLSIRRSQSIVPCSHAQIEAPLESFGAHPNLRQVTLVGHSLHSALATLSTIPSPLHNQPSIEVLHCAVGDTLERLPVCSQPGSILSKVMSSITRFTARSHSNVCSIEGFSDDESRSTPVLMMAIEDRLPPCSSLIRSLFPLTSNFAQIRSMQLQATHSSPGIDEIAERLHALPNLEEFGLTATMDTLYCNGLAIDDFLLRLSGSSRRTGVGHLPRIEGWLCPKLSKLNFASVTVKKDYLMRFIRQRYGGNKKNGPTSLDVFRIWGSWPEVPTGCKEVEEVTKLVKQTGRIHRFLWT